MNSEQSGCCLTVQGQTTESLRRIIGRKLVTFALTWCGPRFAGIPVSVCAPSSQNRKPLPARTLPLQAEEQNAMDAWPEGGDWVGQKETLKQGGENRFCTVLYGFVWFCTVWFVLCSCLRTTRYV